ncbi:uncharacterized protein LOC131214222 [Anopheles bellator]|uniref:uncharacterized protein LOC131214222 n=1 Tax=Anopheles bellator TaxID=139047 RepID=UPI002649CEAA|nr:uncharacterized protein LOC131214222 [Anopheles bellator]
MKRATEERAEDDAGDLRGQNLPGEEAPPEEEGYAELENLHHSQETRKFYQKLNASRRGFVPRAEMCRDKDGSILTGDREVTERWKQHYDEHLNGAQAEDHGGGESDPVGVTNVEDVPAPTISEVKDAIKQLKNNKSAGKDGLGAELIKMGPEKLASCLHRLIARIWDTERLPEEWKDGVICPIYKKGDKLDCANYRAITILNTAYKVLSRIIFCRLSPLANRFVGSYQAGFVEGRSTTDQIFTIRQILQKCREHRTPTHHLFIDFKAAYDTIDREELWKVMDENGFPGKLIRLIKATVDGTQCCVRISGGLSSPFETRRGLRQVDGLSCLLFNIALQGVMNRADTNTRGTIYNKSSQFVCFADDMDIVGRTTAAVSEQFARLKREAAKVGLLINASKTKYMLASGTEADRQRLGSSIVIDGDEFEVVDEFVYLGSLVTSDNDTSREIRRRIISGSRAYYGLHRQLRSRRLSLRTKCNLYKTLIRPVVLYGHETWTMLEEDRRVLGVFERRVLRTIFGGVQENGVWRRRMNYELAQLYGEPSIQKVVIAGRIRWAGHVVRMPDNCPAKMVFASDPVLSGHGFVREYFHVKKLASSPNCPHCQEHAGTTVVHSMQHVLFECPEFSGVRQELLGYSEENDEQVNSNNLGEMLLRDNETWCKIALAAQRILIILQEAWNDEQRRGRSHQPQAAQHGAERPIHVQADGQQTSAAAVVRREEMRREGVNLRQQKRRLDRQLAAKPNCPILLGREQRLSAKIALCTARKTGADDSIITRLQGVLNDIEARVAQTTGDRRRAGRVMSRKEARPRLKTAQSNNRTTLADSDE